MDFSKWLAAGMLAAAGIATAAPARATLIETDSAFNNGTTNLTPTFTVSNSDLINGLTPVTTGTFNAEGTGNPTVLTDGSFPDPVSRAPDAPFEFSQFAVLGNAGGTSLTYTLAGPSNITAINSYGGWQDNGRDQQLWSVAYAVAGNPNTFIPLTSVDFNPQNVPSGKPSIALVSLTDSTGTLISNVVALQFTYGNVENGYTGYGEIDVIGQPVPEPSSCLLLGLGAVSLLGMSRRRKFSAAAR